MATYATNQEKWFINKKEVVRAYVGDELVYPLDDGGGGDGFVGTWGSDGAIVSESSYYASKPANNCYSESIAYDYLNFVLHKTDPQLSKMNVFTLGDDLWMYDDTGKTRGLLNLVEIEEKEYQRVWKFSSATNNTPAARGRISDVWKGARP